MEKILFLDTTAGIAGDMLVAALLDLGVPLEALQEPMDGLGFGPLELSVETVRRGPFQAKRFLVGATDGQHPHRTWAEIREKLQGAPISSPARERAMATFSLLAEAEGRVHGVSPEDVTFHEVGAVDSIADVVGAALALEYLGVGRVVVAPLPMGSGTVETAHGVIPLPAPATLACLEGWPLRPAPGPGEWVTPTGAALAAAMGEPGGLPPLVLLGVGHGAGSRDGGPVPNVLRALLGRPSARTAGEDRVTVVETQVDDMPGEWLPPLFDRLLEAGALDVSSTALIMKRGRPGLLISALAPPGLAGQVADVMLTHSSTIGVRTWEVERRVLARRSMTVETPYGEVRVKVVELPGGGTRCSPEHQDCQERAEAAGVPVSEVSRSALMEAQHRT